MEQLYRSFLCFFSFLLIWQSTYMLVSVSYTHLHNHRNLAGCSVDSELSMSIALLIDVREENLDVYKRQVQPSLRMSSSLS